MENKKNNPARIRMYTVEDLKGERFDTPFFTIHELNAKRKFMMDIKKPGTLLNSYPKDFQLIHIADFDYLDGVMKAVKRKIVLEGKSIELDKEK